VIVCRLVSTLLPAANKDFMKRAISRGRGMGTTASVKMRFAELDLMQKLPFKFLHKVLLPQQVVRPG
jgi:hypothetical protein